MKFDATSLTIIQDSREQNPWDLSPLRVQIGTLDTGDYAVHGLDHICRVERKSLLDFVACCGRERDRFKRELVRLRGFPVSAVIIESTWSTIESGTWKTPNMKMTPNHVLGSLTGWIAAGHTIIVAPRDMAARIARSVLQHVARRRLAEVKPFLAAMSYNVNT